MLVISDRFPKIVILKHFNLLYILDVGIKNRRNYYYVAHYDFTYTVAPRLSGSELSIVRLCVNAAKNKFNYESQAKLNFLSITMVTGHVRIPNYFCPLSYWTIRYPCTRFRG